MSGIPIPVEIHRDDHQIVLKWSANHETAFSARDLRLACQCAQCRDEMTGKVLLHSSSVPEDVRPLSIELVGAYGFRVQWSDGHGTGIYTYESLYDGEDGGEEGDANSPDIA